MRAVARCAGLIGFAASFVATVALAQTKAPEFEVASVKPVAGDSSTRPVCLPERFTADKARVDIRCVPSLTLIEYAFEVPSDRITRPDWMVGLRWAPIFDIAAKLPEGATEDQIPEMLQALLVERFHLAVHRESKEQPCYALVVDKDGLKLREASPDAAPDTTADERPPIASGRVNFNGVQLRETYVRNSDGKGFTDRMTSSSMGTVRYDEFNPKQLIEAPSITMGGLADLLRVTSAIPVVDMTGLKGRYQIVLGFMEEYLTATGRPVQRPSTVINPQLDLSGFTTNMKMYIPAARQPDMLDAVQHALKKLGLRLEPSKAPVETIVIDHMDKMPTGN